MACNWNETTLGECATWLSGGTPFKGNDAFWSGSIPWVSAKDMKSFRLHDAEDHISPAAIGNGGKLVPAGTILLLVRGMTLHNDVPICMVTREMAFNQDIKALRPANDVDGAFLAYWLLAHKPDLLASVDHAGHGTGRLVTDTLKEKVLRLPSLAEQKRIAEILGALDDKIELNQKLNHHLEQMARALFRSWFVDFDPIRAKASGHQPAGIDAETAAIFPASFEDSPLGPIPKGWNVAVVDDILRISRDSLDPGDSPDECFEHFSLPAFDAGQKPAHDMGESIKSLKFVVPLDCVLVSKLNPHTPRVWIPSSKGNLRQVASTEFLVCVGDKSKSISREFIFCLSRSDACLEYLGAHAGGTSNSHQRVRPQDFLEYRFPKAPTALLEAFTTKTKPIFDQIAILRAQSISLAALRDTLLPKLLSGELSVAEAGGK